MKNELDLNKLPSTLDSFNKWEGDEPFEDHAGPFFMRAPTDGLPYLAGFNPEERHMNGGGMLHGGLLMAFADYSLFIIAKDIITQDHCVTVSCHTDFMRGAGPKAPVFAYGQVSRNTRSLIFIRGQVVTRDEGELASFTGIIKRLGVK
ncbi:PaaI family thioesterase [Alphaproteobacteria bacterium]|jgi:uncharacterized protein (TIGR00369 family)|nr:PaaI family thioesterase [Alphaproteobacteria bacterium]